MTYNVFGGTLNLNQSLIYTGDEHTFSTQNESQLRSTTANMARKKLT